MNHYVVKMGHVESVEDDAGGLRIKARLAQDGDQDVSKLPYSFPLLPKTFRTVPKVGEGVLVILSELGNNDSNRYYLGPIISQDQFQGEDKYDYGRGGALSLLQGGEVEPLTNLSKYEDTKGSFPLVGDIAVVGRKSEDIVLKEDEIDIRCGIRTEPINNPDKNLVGNIMFNKLNPAYIQLKYKKGIGFSKKQEADSVINLVADKINLISHKINDNENNDNNIILTDKNELIKTSDMDSIMAKLHQVPYGDVLVECLEYIRGAIVNHVHPYPGMRPCIETYIMDLLGVNFYDILSNDVRIS